MATINLGRVGFVNKGAHNIATAYKVNDVVTYNGGTYACVQAHTGQLPTATAYWQNWVANDKALDSSVVHKTGDETIAGVKTFSSGINLQNQNVSPFSGFKNYIINGNFDVWQYGTSQTLSGYGSDDRWANGNFGSTKTHSGVACTDTERTLFNATAFSRTVVNSVAGAGSAANKTQPIENVTRLAGKTVTLSFWAKADSNKNIAVEFLQRFGSGGTPSAEVNGIGSQIVSLTTTWQKKTVTVTLPSIVGKTLGTDGVHTSSTLLAFWLDAGSNFNTRTANLGQQSGTFDIAQVQLEEGSVATPFENRPYGLELSLCQRYYEEQRIMSSYGSATYITICANYKVKKRTYPTTVVIDEIGNIDRVSAILASGAGQVNGIVLAASSVTSDYFRATIGGNNGQYGGAIFTVKASAEL